MKNWFVVLSVLFIFRGVAQNSLEKEMVNSFSRFKTPIKFSSHGTFEQKYRLVDSLSRLDYFNTYIDSSVVLNDFFLVDFDSDGDDDLLFHGYANLDEIYPYTELWMKKGNAFVLSFSSSGFIVEIDKQTFFLRSYPCCAGITYSLKKMAVAKDTITKLWGYEYFDFRPLQMNDPDFFVIPKKIRLYKEINISPNTNAYVCPRDSVNMPPFLKDPLFGVFKNKSKALVVKNYCDSQKQNWVYCIVKKDDVNSERTKGEDSLMIWVKVNESK